MRRIFLFAWLWCFCWFFSQQFRGDLRKDYSASVCGFTKWYSRVGDRKSSIEGCCPVAIYLFMKTRNVKPVAGTKSTSYYISQAFYWSNPWVSASHTIVSKNLSKKETLMIQIPLPENKFSNLKYVRQLLLLAFCAFEITLRTWGLDCFVIGSIGSLFDTQAQYQILKLTL